MSSGPTTLGRSVNSDHPSLHPQLGLLVAAVEELAQQSFDALLPLTQLCDRGTDVLRILTALLAPRHGGRGRDQRRGDRACERQAQVDSLRSELRKANEANGQLQKRLAAAASVIGALHADNATLRGQQSVRGGSVVPLELARSNRE
ncbi:MAG: hypothetical protein HOW97_23350 [Catenulispora sp.]|nr:hypothetical protein [Catenulispora sp.]